jgi:FixJ family two-component response regulator
VTPQNAKHVVVGVDDDFRVRESIARLTESAGYAPLVFASAEALLESGILSKTACVIVDVRMPGMDGLELQRRVRTEYPSLPIIFISAHVDDEIRRRALAGGAVDFLYKPFDGEHLLLLIRRALESTHQD